MSEYESRGRSHAATHAQGSSYAETYRAQRTPAEQAGDQIAALARTVMSVGGALDAVRRAHHANDPRGWQEAKQQLDRHIAVATRALNNARARAHEAAPAARHQVAAAESDLAEYTNAADTLSEAPRGWNEVSREAEIVSIATAPFEGGAKEGWARKQTELEAVIDQLSVAECQTLARRLAKPYGSDPIATALAPGIRINQARHDELVGYLQGARRREAIRTAPPHATAAATSKATSMPTGPEPHVDPVPTPAKTVAEAPTVHVTNASVTTHGAKPETVDAELQQVLEAGGDHVEAQLVAVFATLDGTTRRALARRLETYRPGSGDVLAARFQRLERATKLHLVAALRSDAPAQARSEQSSARAPGELVPTVEAEDARVGNTNKNAWLHHPGDAAHYFELHQKAFLVSLRSRLGASGIGTGDPRLHWAQGPERFIELASIQLTGPDVSEWPGLLYPADPWHVIDAHRLMDAPTGGRTGAMSWIPSLGLALAGEIEVALRHSLSRMSARYVTAGGAGTHVLAQELIASHPMDRVVAGVLCGDQVVVVDQGRHRPRTHQPDVQADGLRLITDFEWLGTHDPQLWNWIRVKEPRDATVEEVAMTLFGNTEFAYVLAAAWPCVAVPERWALQLPAMEALRPILTVSGFSSALSLTGTYLADDVALAQGTREQAQADAARKPGEQGPVPPDRAHLVDGLDSTAAILGELDARLAPFAIGGMSNAAKFVQEKRAWLLSASHEDLTRWTPVFSGQHEIVSDAASGVAQVVALLAGLGVRPEELQNVIHPGRLVLSSYAEAAGTSMFVATARSTLAQSKIAHAMLPLALLQRSHLETDVQIGGLRRAEASDPRTARRLSSELAPEQAQVAGDIARLQSQVLAGGSPDADLLEAASIATASLSMRARIGNLQHALASLRDAASAADEGIVAKVANAFSTRLLMLPFELDTIIAELGDVESLLADNGPAAVNRKFDALPPGNGREFARRFELHEGRRAKLEAAQREFSAVAKRRRLDKGLFEDAASTIADAKLRTLLVDVGAMVAIAVASGGIASIAGDFASGLAGGARSVTTLADAVEVTRTARVVGAVANFTVDAATNAVGQTALHGGKIGASFAENLLSNVAVLAALKPLHGIARSWGVLDEQAFKLWEKQGKNWRVALAKGTVISAELITSAAVGYATHRVMTGFRGEPPDQMTVAEWAAQGATMVLGRYVHAKLGDSLERLKLAGRGAGELVGRMKRQLVLAAAVEHSGSVDAGMELFIQHHQVLEEEVAFWRTVLEDPAALHHLGMTRAQAEVSLRGAEGESASVKGQAFVQLQLRLAGLDQEVAGGRLWVGNTEDIAIALAQATRMSLPLEIKAHDEAARQWHVTLNGEDLVIRERAREGRTREATPKDDVAGPEVAKAKRYATAAQTLRPVVEAHVKHVVEAGPSFVTEVAHIGDGFGGVMHRDTRFEQGVGGDPHREIVIYSDHGAMTNRGELRSGQNPDLQTMPGVRTREQTTDQHSYTKSRDLGDATEIGRLEMQTPGYQAQVTGLERRSHHGPDAWEHSDKPMRLKVVNEQGTKRWIYCDRIESAGGMGPTDFSAVPGKLGEPGDPAQARGEQFAAMRAKGVLVGGDDPRISEKLHEGQRVLVWGGSPTGAWAGEDAARHGAKPDVVGESPAVHRDASTPEGVMTASEFERSLQDARGNPELVAQLVERRIAHTHSGSKLARNRQPGATYGSDAKQHGISVEIGVPTSMRLLPNGKVEVTIGVGEAHAGVHRPGEAARPVVREYDLIVVALGQDPGAPGGPAALLGKGVTKRDANNRIDLSEPVPEGTIALRMVRDSSNDGRLVGLESEDGTYRLVGAAYASEKLAPWVIPSERGDFIAKTRAIGSAGERTHTGDIISSSSTGVTTAIEAQRDRIPVANEVIAAREYRLPSAVSAERLSLPTDHPEHWAERLEEFLTASMRARPGRVEVVLQASGRDGVHVFRVTNGSEEVGIVRVYDSMPLADAEAQLAKQVEAAVPSLHPGAERGTVAVAGGTTAQLASHGREPNLHRAATFDGIVDAWAHAEGDAKKLAYNKLEAAVVRTAKTLAALHNHFAQDGGGLMTAQAKQAEIQATHATLDSPQVAAALGAEEVARIRAKLAPFEAAFMSARLPATAELGRADADAFAYKNYRLDPAASATNKRPTMAFEALSVEDLGAMRSSLDPDTHKGSGTGAADVARFLESVRRDPRIGGEFARLRQRFMTEYTKVSGVPEMDARAGRDWFAIAAEVTSVVDGVPGAPARLEELVP